MNEAPGPQAHNAGITPGYVAPKPIPQRVTELEKFTEYLAGIVESQSYRLDELEKENRRLRAAAGGAAK